MSYNTTSGPKDSMFSSPKSLQVTGNNVFDRIDNATRELSDATARFESFVDRFLGMEPEASSGMPSADTLSTIIGGLETNHIDIRENVSRINYLLTRLENAVN